MTQAYTHNFVEVHEPGGNLVPDLRAPGVYDTPWLSMQNHQRMIFIIHTGPQAPNSTIDFAVRQATNAAGGGAAAMVPAKAIVQLTQVGGDDDDLVIVEVRTEEMDVNNQYDFLSGRLTIGGANSYCAVIPLRGCSNYPPVSQAGWTEVVL